MELVWKSSTPSTSGLLLETTTGERVLERACAECRRSKYQCDKRVPCNGCTRRGLKHLCPDNSLTSVDGNRRFWNTTVELRAKSGELSQRILDLEDALRISHALTGRERHPLLADELVALKDPFLGRSPSPNPQIAPDDIIRNTHGTLMVTASGLASYYGPHATSWSFLKNEGPTSFITSQDLRMPDTLPEDIMNNVASFSHTLMGSTIGVSDPHIWLATLRCYLPSLDEAHRLFNTYFEYAAFGPNSLPVDQAFRELLPSVYDQYDASSRMPLLAHHRLALVFGVFSAAVVVDPTVQPRDSFAAHYAALSRAALVSGKFMENPTCEAVQSLLIMAQYLTLTAYMDSNSCAEWSVVGVAARLSHKMGLHCDPTSFHLSTDEADKRRRVYVAVFIHESWMSLKYSLPSSVINNAAIDIPLIQNPTIDDFFTIWKFSFARECIQAIHGIFSLPSPTYASVLDVDAKIRAHRCPSALDMPAHGSEHVSMATPGESPAMIVIRTTTFAVRELAILLLHREFAYSVTVTHAQNPLSSVFGSSLIACYEASKAIIGVVHSCVTIIRHPVDRIWFFVDITLTAAVTLATLIIRCPAVSFAEDAVAYLDSAAVLVDSLAAGFGEQTLSRILLSLRDTATARYHAAHHQSQDPSEQQVQNAEALLTQLGGSTRFNRVAYISGDY